ncbi:MAG: hypothetical protein MK291_03290 [Planctomycetes bacterium]|nr:hypothetical protein [Planctomycetota bacterium]
MRHVLLPCLVLTSLTTANAQFSAGRMSSPGTQATSSNTISQVVGGNDSCGAADAISGQGLFAFDNSSATTGSEGQSEASCYVFGTSVIANDVWFAWTADASGVAQISTCSQTTVDTKLAAYAGSACPSDGSAIACNDDACGFQSTLNFSVSSGSTYLLQVGTWDGASGGTGALDISITDEPEGYQYDLGTATNNIGLSLGGDIWWGNLFAAEGGSDTITEVQTSFGAAAIPGSIANGSAVTVGLWDDVNDDGDPSDGALLWSTTTTVTNADTDILNSYSTGGVAVSGNFIVGVICTHSVGEYPAPLDESFSSNGRSFAAYSDTPGGFDLNDLSLNDFPPADLDVIGFPAVLMTRAIGSGDTEPGLKYCFGDGIGTPCPCSNNGALGEGCANDTGSGAVLTATGSASVAADDLVLTATNLTPGPGLYFQGNNAVNSGNGNPFGDGLRCAGGSVRRLEVLFANAGNSFTTATTISIVTDGAISVGQTRRYQYWYRDSGTSPCSSLFNLSNGYQVTWGA